ncbi:MAG TPA: PhzF family phenazine biosynthesis protein [Nitrospiria bacterium]|nr:PhzF family phenazine biosynthesis protein [Nitrospiria bacterium]
MSPVEAYRVRVFGAQPGTGNPAVVVLESGGWSDEVLQALAAKAAVPDTAFISTDPVNPGRLDIRWFTPTTEVGLCGHATLASARVIQEKTRQDRVEFHSAKTRLVVTREGDLSWLELPVPAIGSFDGSRNDIAEALQIWGSETELKLPLALTPERDVIIPLSEAADLYAIEPDFDRLAEVGRAVQARGFCLLSRQKREPASAFSLRFFAPHIGIPEDPATGSVVGPLALYALTHGWATWEPIVRLRFEQGDAVNLPCRLQVEMTSEGNRPVRLRVGGLTSTPESVTL